MKCSVLMKFVSDKILRQQLLEEHGLTDFQSKFQIKKPNYIHSEVN